MPKVQNGGKKNSWQIAMAVNDAQSQAVYAAEEQAWKASSGQALPKVLDIESYLSTIFESRWFRREFPRAAAFEVLGGRGMRHAWGRLEGDICRISIPRPLRFELIALHELSHAVGAPNHGPIFCSCYLKLVRQFISPSAARVLQFCFLTGGVKHRRPSYQIDWEDDFACDESVVGPEPYLAGNTKTLINSY